jgi:DNA-binding transcriptional regulator YhcF (GntR family)
MDNVTVNNVPLQAYVKQPFTLKEVRVNQAAHLRSAVAALKWRKVMGRAKQAILQAHITVYGRTKEEVWGLCMREAHEISKVRTATISDATKELIDEGWLRLMEKPSNKEDAYKYAMGHKLNQLLQEDVEPITINEVAGQSKDYALQKSRVFKPCTNVILISLQKGNDTMTTIAKDTGLNRDTIRKALEPMEMYSIIFRVGRKIVFNTECDLAGIAAELRTDKWLEKVQLKHKRERDDYHIQLEKSKARVGYSLQIKNAMEEQAALAEMNAAT